MNRALLLLTALVFVPISAEPQTDPEPPLLSQQEDSLEPEEIDKPPEAEGDDHLVGPEIGDVGNTIAEVPSAAPETSNFQELDLVAQRGMNKSTKRMADYSLIQTVLIAVGTVALLLTLWETRKASRAATEAAESTRDAVDASVLIARTNEGARFLVEPGKAKVEWSESEFRMELRLSITNIGKGPATGVTAYASLAAVNGTRYAPFSEIVRWAYPPTGQRQIPPWTLEKSLLRPDSHISESLLFVQALSRHEIEDLSEESFAQYPTFELHIFFEWIDTFGEKSTAYIVLDSYHSGALWTEVERGAISFDTYREITNYPY